MSRSQFNLRRDHVLMMRGHDLRNCNEIGIDIQYPPFFPMHKRHVLISYSSSMIQLWRPEHMIVQRYPVVESLSSYNFAPLFVTLSAVSRSAGEVLSVNCTKLRHIIILASDAKYDYHQPHTIRLSVVI